MPTWDELSDAARLDLRLREIDAAEALLDVLPRGRDRRMVAATLQVLHADLRQVLEGLGERDPAVNVLPPLLVDRAWRTAARTGRPAARAPRADIPVR